MSDNPRSFGGGTFCRIGHDPSRTLDLPVETVTHVLEEAGLDHVDIFKIDTEGSEMAILRENGKRNRKYGIRHRFSDPFFRPGLRQPARRYRADLWTRTRAFRARSGSG